MIRIPEGGWGAGGDDDSGGSLLTGTAAPLPLGNFRIHADPFAAPQDDDPVTRADTMRERAGAVFQRQRAVGAFNRDLDDLSANIAEGTNWSDGLNRFDREIGNLRQKHGAALSTPEDRTAFERHAQEFASMQRIGLKRSLLERQQADALTQLDDHLAYYAGKAATAPNEVFRQIALDAGQRAIEELRDAGYLFPAGAEKRRQTFLGLIDGADLENIVRANPDDALAVLDNPTLFPNADAALRKTLRELFFGTPPRPGEEVLPDREPPIPPVRKDPDIVPLDEREGAAADEGEAGSDGPRAADGAAAGIVDVDAIEEALAPLIEKDDGLRTLLDELRENPDEPVTLVRLAQSLAGGVIEVPSANSRAKPLLDFILRKLGELIPKRSPRPPSDKEPKQLPPPKQEGEPGQPAPKAPPPGLPRLRKPPLPDLPPQPGHNRPPDGGEPEQDDKSPNVARDPFADRPARSQPQSSTEAKIKNFHTINDRDEILSRAKEAQPALDDMLKRKAEGIEGARSSGSRIKELEELDDKIRARGAPNKVGDYLGGRIVVDSWEALDKVIERLKQTGRVIERDDKIAKPNPSGYRAIHLQIEAENGISVEVQIQPREIHEADKLTHPIYEKYRRREIPPEEQAAYERDMEEMKRIYREAWNTWIERNGAR